MVNTGNQKAQMSFIWAFFYFYFSSSTLINLFLRICNKSFMQFTYRLILNQEINAITFKT